LTVRRVLHVIETLAPREGGPPRVVAGLLVAQRARGLEAHVLCGDGVDLPEHLAHWRAHAPGFPESAVHAVSGSSLLGRRAALQAWLRAHLHNFDVLHVHSLWRLVPAIAANASRHLGKPYLIAPHTAMSHWALSQKRLKKSVARWLLWNRIFRGAAGFHALNEIEAAEIGDCFAADAPPIFVVPNGVSLAEFSGPPARAVPAALENLLSAPEGGAPFVLFLARLHSMKGPDLLLEAFATVAAAHPQLQLAYAGPDYGMLGRLREGVAAHALGSRVHFLGLVSGAERRWLLDNATCVCQPSRDEGFSLSILEALACSRPVVISDRCKFPQVAASGAGIVVPLSSAQLAIALESYASDPARRACDGRRGRALIEASYNLEVIAALTEEMYVKAVAGLQQAAGPRQRGGARWPANSQPHE
jgi:glycosyltransferase involved in cell wall biosynthesis